MFTNFKFLNANEAGTTAAERHWTVKKAELNQPVYYKNILTSEWKPRKVL